MKRNRLLSAALAALLSLTLFAGCANTPPEHESSSLLESVSQSKSAAPMVFTDALDREITLESHERVVSLYGSFAETWLLAGGTLTGVTSDAVEERGLNLTPDVRQVGTVKEPNFEEILAAEPDFLILSADIAPQVDLAPALEEAHIPHAYFRVDTFEDYQNMLALFCAMNDRPDLLEQNGHAVQKKIDAVKALVAGQPAPTVLFLRAFSTGVKAKGDDNETGVMLRELGAENLVERHASLLEDLSMEEVIAADPAFILVTYMGASEEKALTYLKEHVESNPAWAGLSAVKNDRYLMLPKELFHYKPNARWGESYVYLAKILYPALAAQLDAL